MFDIYKTLSLKIEARKQRGQGFRQRIKAMNKTPQNWRSVLRDGSDRTDLFNFLADKMCSADTGTISVTKRDDALSNKERPLNDVAPMRRPTPEYLYMQRMQPQKVASPSSSSKQMTLRLS